MSDILVITLGLLAGSIGCLARPCRPEHWTQVKAARVELAPWVSAESGRDFELEPEPMSEPEPASEPGFATAWPQRPPEQAVGQDLDRPGPER